MAFKKIRLSQGRHALVDSEDFDWLSQWKWTLMRHKAPIDGAYAYRKEGTKTVLMHREILEAPKGKYVDHRNKRGLDNRKANIRLCSPQQNAWARRTKGGSSKFCGVHWCNTKQCWVGKIQYDGTTKILIYTLDEVEAARAYDKVVLKLHGEFAEINGV